MPLNETAHWRLSNAGRPADVRVASSVSGPASETRHINGCEQSQQIDGQVIPALRRALDVNKSGRPAYIEFILSSSAASTSELDGAQSEAMPKLSGHLENADTMCHDETQRTGGTP